MTIQELHKWAVKFNVQDLPLYGSDDDGEFSGMIHEAAEDDDIFSECCGASMTGEMVDVGICPKCHEHCEVDAESLPERVRLKL